MPNRIIKESARTSRTLNKLSAEAERLFWRLLTVADDYGLFEAEPDLLLSTCFPLKVSTLKSTIIEKWFQELLTTHLVGCYDDGERVLGQFLTWEHHQQIRAKRAKFPLPTPEMIRFHLQSDDSIGNHVQPNVPVIQSNPIQSESESESNPIQSSSCAAPSGFARAEQGQNGRQPTARKNPIQISEQALILATKLKDSILANIPDARVPTAAQVREWARDLDKLNRLDGKTWEQIEWLLAWSQKDQFWSKNIQSGAKFSKQWNQLLAKASAERPKYSTPLTEAELNEEDDFARLTREELEKKEHKYGHRPL